MFVWIGLLAAGAVVFSTLPYGRQGAVRLWNASMSCVRGTWEQRVDIARRELADYLDREYPMYRNGDRVEIRKTDGLVIRGSMDEVGTKLLTLSTDAGLVTVPLQEVDLQARIRCDRHARESFVKDSAEARARNRSVALPSVVEELLRNAAPPATTGPVPGGVAQREAVSNALDRQFPPFRKGDTLELVLKDGRILRGRYEGVVNNLLLMDEAVADRQEINLDKLQFEDRVRCDALLRESYLESRLTRASVPAGGP